MSPPVASVARLAEPAVGWVYRMKTLYCSMLLLSLVPQLASAQEAEAREPTFMLICNPSGDTAPGPFPPASLTQSKALIDVLKAQFGNRDIEGASTDTCKRTYDSLLTQESLDLMHVSSDYISVLTDLKRLKKLWVRGNQLSIIPSLKNMTSLQDILIAGASISDIHHLKDARALKSIAITGGSFESLSALESLNLEYLQIESSELSDVSALASMASLETLHLSSEKLVKLSFNDVNRIKSLWIQSPSLTDASEIDKLKSLEDLYLSAGAIQSWGFLNNLPNLKSLTIANCSLENVNALTALVEPSKLETLQIIGCNVKDVSGFVRFDQLKNLTIRDAQLTDVSFMSSMRSLKNVDLSGNSQLDLTTVSSLKDLSSLNLDGVDLSTKAAQLTSLTNLKSLSAVNSKLENMDFIADMSKLENLNLSQNQITSVPSDSKLGELKYLFVDHNQVGEQLSFLQKSSNLEVLSVEKTGISGRYIFPNLPKLTHLDVANNEMNDSSKFLKFKNLESIDVKNNKIVNFSPLYIGSPGTTSRIPALTWLRDVEYAGNPIEDSEFVKQAISGEQIDALNEEADQLAKEINRTTSDYLMLMTKPDMANIMVEELQCLRLQMHIENISKFMALVSKSAPATKFETLLSDVAADQARNYDFLKVDQGNCPRLSDFLNALGDAAQPARKLALTKTLPIVEPFFENMPFEDMDAIRNLYSIEDSFASLSDSANNVSNEFINIKKVMYDRLMAAKSEGSEFLARVERIRLSKITQLQDTRNDLLAAVLKNVKE